MDIKALIREARPNVRDSTINKYVQGINKLHSLLVGNTPIKNLDFLKNKEKVTKAIEDKYTSNTSANLFNVIVVALKADDGNAKLAEYYSEKRDHEHSIYESVVRSNKKTVKQEENWVTLEEVDKVLSVLNEHFQEIYDQFLETNKLSRRQYLKAQEFIVLAIHRQIPMRNDLAGMAWGIVTGVNWINKDGDKFKFNLETYKTSGKYGRRDIVVEDETLNSNIEKFSQMNHFMQTSEVKYFILNSKMEKMSSNGLTKLLNKIFSRDLDKKISSSMLRHIYLSDKYSKELQERKKDSHNMMHSLQQQKDYIKI